MASLPYSAIRWAGALALGAGALGALSGPAQAAADGRQISTQGANGAPACVTCHGANGEGNPAAGFPHLAGMGAAYLAEQLDAMANGVGFEAIKRTMHIHPTVSELVPTLLGDLKPAA